VILEPRNDAAFETVRGAMGWGFRLVLLLLSFGWATRTVDAQAPRGRIEGRVVLANDLSPLAGVDITVTTPLNAVVRNGRTDAAGRYAFDFLPPQISLAGTFAPVRKFPGAGSVVAWNSVSPRAGVTIPVGRLFGGTRISAGCARYYHVLPASYANFSNPTALGGQVFAWKDSNGDNLFQKAEAGTLLRVFGGPYSAVDAGLKRPFTDEFSVVLDQSLGERFAVELRGFQRQQRRLVQPVNVGVPPSAYKAVEVTDEGDDNVPGTADDRVLTVFNQDAATLGQDRFLLTNPRS
jgi:hypothetical protein